METTYSTVTEMPGIGASREQLMMLYTRYKFASQFCHGRRVLEVACGAGQGLGYLARVATRVVGGDIDEENLKCASNHYQGQSNIEIKKLDAHHLTFEGKSFDTILLFEAIYYLEQPDVFLRECRRVLSDDGTIVICTVNREWQDFNPSPFSKKYFSASELSQMLRSQHFTTQIMGAFPVEAKTAKDKIISFIKRIAVTLHLIPRTMKGKQFLKRLFFGKLTPLPAEVKEGMAEFVAPVPLPPTEFQPHFKVLFAIAHL